MTTRSGRISAMALASPEFSSTDVEDITNGSTLSVSGFARKYPSFDNNDRSAGKRERNYIEKITNCRNGGMQKEYHYMYPLWLDHTLCDVTLECKKSEKLLAHKVTLAAFSESLANSFSEFDNGHLILIDLTDIRAKTVHAVLSFLYKTEITLSSKTVNELLFCASVMGITSLSSICEQYILSNLNPVNAIYFCEEALFWKEEDLTENIIQFMIENFKAMTNRDVMEIMPEHILHLLVEFDMLNIDDEFDVFTAIVNWVEADKDNRIHRAVILLRCVRYKYMEVDRFIEETDKVAWMQTSMDCHIWMYEVLRYHALSVVQSKLLKTDTPHQVRRSYPQRE